MSKNVENWAKSIVQRMGSLAEKLEDLMEEAKP